MSLIVLTAQYAHTLNRVLELEQEHLRSNTRPGITPLDLIAHEFEITNGEALTLLNKAHDAQRGLEPCPHCHGTGKVVLG